MTWGYTTVEDRLSKAFPWLSFGVSAFMSNRRFTDQENGIQIIMTVEGVQGNIPLCTIVPPSENKASYPEDFALSTTTREQSWGENLWFNPVPLEMLYTPALTPQVLVKIDGLEAICKDDNCGYSYIEAVGGLTDVQKTDDDLTVSGTLLDHTQACVSGETEELKVTLGDSQCEISPGADLSSGAFDCTLTSAPMAGDHLAKVTGLCGDFDNSSTTAFNFQLSLTSVQMLVSSNYVAATDLNPRGGDSLKITGTGFP